MTRHEGGCLCGQVRFETRGQPERVTFCHCRFCQRATGSAYMVEPIFDKAAFGLISGVPKIYDQISSGSGKVVYARFCADCGTRLWLSFERFPDAIGVYAGTFDDPCWFGIDPGSAKHIFVGVARSDTVIPAGLPTFVEHAFSMEGAAREATTFPAHHLVGQD